MEWFEKIDTDFWMIASSKLEKMRLLGKPNLLYVIDCGLGHGLKIAKELERTLVSGTLLVNYQDKERGSRAGLDDRIKKYGNLDRFVQPKSHSLVIDGHRVDDDYTQLVRDEIKITLLQNPQVSHVVFLLEAFKDLPDSSTDPDFNYQQSYVFKKFQSALQNKQVTILNIDPGSP